MESSAERTSVVAAPARARLLTGRVPGTLRRRLTPEHGAVAVLGLLVLVVHDLGYVLTQPYWTDEAWVAVTTRFPLTDLPATTSSTPIGWSLLLRAFTVGRSESGRLLPVAFAASAVVVAYWLARGMGWASRRLAVAAGALAAIGALLAPAMLVRNDLKQYTADACLALLVLAVTARLERGWSRRGLVLLSVTVWAGMLLSHTTAFVGAAAFTAVCLVQLARQAWCRFGEAAVTGVVTAALMLAVYESFDARAVVPGLTDYWQHYYLPVGSDRQSSVRFVETRFHQIREYLGLGPSWLVGLLVLAGLVTMFRCRRPAAAVTVILLWPAMLAASAAKKYPFLDLRTSTFLLTVTVVVAAIGVAGICAVVARLLRGTVAALVAAAAVAAFATNAATYARQHTIPNENVRDQARYVAAHAAPDDVVLVNLSSNWGFGYYWPYGQPARRADSAVAQGYVAYFPDQRRIVVAGGRHASGVAAALDEALGRVREHPGARVWLIRTHVASFEQAAWKAALQRDGQAAIPVGSDGLAVISPR